MAYQDDFRNKVIEALKKKNLAVDLSQELTQQAIINETQNVAQSESQPLTPEEMRSIIQDVTKEVYNNKTFTASSDFVAFDAALEGPLSGTEGSYSGGGIASSAANKDIIIIPSNGGLGAAGTATSVNSLSQIDFKHIANPNAYAAFDPNEVKASMFNWAERIVGVNFDTPVLGLGGAWGGVSYAPTAQWGVGNSQGSGIAGSINQLSGFGQIIYFKPATSTIYSSLFNDVAISSDFASRYISFTGYQSAVPGVFPTAGFAVSFGGIGGSGPLAISGAASNAQSNQIKFLSPLTISNSTAANTLTLGLSSATSTVQNFVGGGSAQYVLSSTTSSFAAGDLFYASGTGHVTLTRLTLGANNTYLSSNGSAPFWTNTIAANTVSVNAATGTTILYPLLNNAAGSGSAVSTDIDFNVDPGSNILRYATGSFYVGTAVSAPTFTGSGNIAIKPGANSTTAIQLDNVAGTPILNVDTTNSRIGINNVTSPTYTLDVAGDINASVGFTYRIAGNKVIDAISLGTGVVSSALTSVGTISTGVWAATAITTLYGGIGNLTPFAVGDLLYANTTTTVAKLADVATGSVLASGGVGVAPSYVATSTLSVGFAITSRNQYVIANTGNADNYVTFTPAISSGTAGVGLSISNAASQLTYNPSLQILKVPIVSGTAVTVTSLTGTIITATQPNITSAASLATVGTITTGIWQGTAVGTTYGGTGSNLGNNTANANKLVVLGTAANGYAATLVDGANSGYLLMANANTSAPSFVNSTNAAFSFASGTLTINNAALTTGTITGVPTNGNDIVNKTYADSISAGLDIHDSARITTLSAIGGSYRQSGTAGTLSGLNDYIISTTPGTLIGSEAGWDTVGTALTNGQRVLVKDGVLGGYASGNGAYGAYPTTYGGFASSWVANGVYTVASYGGAATSGWLLVRAEDSDNGAGLQELTGGTFLFVEEGTNYADHAFVCSNDTQSKGSIGFGSTQIAWTLFAGGNTLIAGQGLVESGNNLALLVNLVEANSVSTGLSRGFKLGGTRAASLGTSTYADFTVTGANSVASSNTFTANSDGWQLAGGQTNRTLTVTGSNITLTGGGNTLTLSSSSTLNLNSQTLSITSATSNITFTPSSTTATTHNLVSSASAQYQLSTADTTFAAGDIYYNTGATYQAMTRLALGTGAGTSVLVRNGAAGPVWGRINLASSDMVVGTLPVGNGGMGAATFTTNGILYGNGTSAIQVTGAAANSVLVTNGSNVPSLSTDIPTAVTIGSAYIYRVGGNDVAIADGGTNTNATPTAGAVAYGNGTAYAFTNAGSAGSVLISNGTNPLFSAINLASTNAVTGVLPIANGGSNATAANFTTNGVVIYDGTRLTSATGITMVAGVGLSVTGTVQSTGGFFISGNSVITSFAGLYGAITISNSASNGGTSFLSTSGQSLVLNYPGTGITGGGSSTQVAYYNAAREITGSANYTYSPTAATGVGLSVNAGTTTGTILYVNNTNGSATSGNLIDVDQNGNQRFAVDYKGMTSIATGAGNTAVVVTGGRTLLASATTNYATLGLTATGTDPSAPNVGDLWYNGTNLYFRKTGGTNFDLLVGSVSGSGTANKLAKWSSSSALTDSNISDAGTGMTITSTSAVGAGGGTTAVLTLQTVSGDNSLTDRYFVRGVTSAGTRLFSIDTAGNLRATTKSFDIPHPTKEGARLVYGVLEGPEHGVYHRGTVEGTGIIQVNLPDYWHKLVGDQYTIQLTPWGNYNVCINSKTENYFTIQLVGDFISRKFKNIKVDYIVHGSRLDAPLDTEQ